MIVCNCTDVRGSSETSSVNAGSVEPKSGGFGFHRSEVHWVHIHSVGLKQIDASFADQTPIDADSIDPSEY